MKTYRRLYPQVHTSLNLYNAYRKARRGKRYKPSIADFEQNHHRLFSLMEMP